MVYKWIKDNKVKIFEYVRIKIYRTIIQVNF